MRTDVQSINVEGLPEPVARAVEVMVETLRQQLEVTMANRPRVELPAWPGTVIGSLAQDRPVFNTLNSGESGYLGEE